MNKKPIFEEKPITKPGFKKYVIKTVDMEGVRESFNLWGCPGYTIDKTLSILKMLFPQYKFEVAYAVFSAVSRFDGMNEDNEIVFIAHLYDEEEEPVNETIASKLQAYEEDENKGLLIRLPFKIGTPVLMIITGRGNSLYIVIEEFDLKHLKAYESGYIFTDVDKAHVRIKELQNV